MSPRRLRERVADTEQAAHLLSDPCTIVELAVEAIAAVCPRGFAFGYTRGPELAYRSLAARYDGRVVPREAMGTRASTPWIVDIDNVPSWQRNRWIEPMHTGVHGPEYFSATHPIRRLFGKRSSPDYGRLMVCHDARLVGWVGVLVDARYNFSGAEQAALSELSAQLAAPLRIAAALDNYARHIPLAPRQNEVMSRVALGWTNKRIARDLEISPATVKTVLERLFTVSGRANRAALVDWWRRG